MSNTLVLRMYLALPDNLGGDKRQHVPERSQVSVDFKMLIQAAILKNESYASTICDHYAVVH